MPSSKRRRACPAGAAIPQLPRPRTHAFTGCGNCRDRHVKCDLGTPGCLNCSRLKLGCEGYSRKYQWIPSKFSTGGRGPPVTLPVEDTEETQTSRRVLFSVEERSAMSLQMREECCENSSPLDLDRVLRDLQDRISDNDGFSRIGPFGILSVTKEPAQPGPDTAAQSVQEISERDLETLGQITTPDLVFSPSQIDWDRLEDPHMWESILAPADVTSNPDFCLTKETFESDDPASWNVSAAPTMSDYTYHATDGADILVYEPSSILIDASTEMIDGSQEYPVVQEQAMVFPSRRLSISTMSNEANLSKVPAEARLLLDYYSERIIAVMSMSSTTKPPWKTIHLPCAMGAFADLIVHGEIRSMARMALFYALLSISSFHIGSASDDINSVYWRERGELHKKKSERLLHSALHDKMPKAARGKYKELLMSGLSMVTIGVFSGNMQDAHAQLAASESLIRREGLPKPVKSQKISKLHHIFSFLRIIHESTSLQGQNKSDSPDTSQTQPQSSQTSGSRLAWVEEDEPDDLEEDSLFVSIYQMPTTLLSLLSQTSSLCKQLNSPEASTPAFARRCQIVEDRIFKWKAPESLSLPDRKIIDLSDESEGPGRDIAAHLVNATYLALIVHFQRQIRNTNPRVLQHYVISAADHLLIHEQLKQSNDIKTAPFQWPSFIISCEAYDATPRLKMDMYLKMVRCYNLGSLVKAEKVVYEVWSRQDSGRADSHWEDVLGDWDMQVVLT